MASASFAGCVPSEQFRNLVRLPTIAVTAFGSPVVRDIAMLAGFNIYLTKPIDIGQLVTVVFDLAGKRRGGFPF
jgi:CheY-like chemotaxis protein